MLRSVQATIDEEGSVRLLEAIHIHGVHRAIVTILDEGCEPEPPVPPGSKRDVLGETAGLWAARDGHGLEYQRRLRSEWDR
ncbi:MAG: hypothetical protein JXR37_15065 [Kiritimatiellae bacterium]|nr:hypothetical protein [Kiritimatiellia bacterium]